MCIESELNMSKTSQKVVFHVSSRDLVGSGKSGQLRRQGKVPANLFGLGKESVPLVVDPVSFRRFLDEHGENTLTYLKIDDGKKEEPVLIEEVQREKMTNTISHVSFKRVSLKEKVKAEIEIELIGEVEIKGAVVSLVKDNVEVEALPTDLPDVFQVDISGLTEVGQVISLNDLQFDRSKVELILGEEEDAAEIPVVIVQAVKEEKEEEPVTETAETTEGGEEEKSEESSENKVE